MPWKIWLAFKDNLKSPAGYGMTLPKSGWIPPDWLGRVGAQPGDQEPCRAAGVRLGQVPRLLGGDPQRATPKSCRN